MMGSDRQHLPQPYESMRQQQHQPSYEQFFNGTSSSYSLPDSRAYQHPLTRHPSRQFESNYGSSAIYTPNNFEPRFDAGLSQPPNLLPGAAFHPINNSSMIGLGNQLRAMGITSSSTMSAQNRTRNTAGTAVPALWMEQPQPSGNGHGQSSQRPQKASKDSEELIPTAMVIKNIPFATKKEELLEIMAKKSLPLPYAFNYHFDHGIFRGLAFCNFSTADETAQVIQAMNNYEISGRNLRVEYKKQLPQEERERIERDKRHRRGQLQEQHLSPRALHNQASKSSIAAHHKASPSPVSMPEGSNTDDGLGEGKEVNMNDPHTLAYYTELVKFNEDSAREVHVFPSELPPQHRAMIHRLAHRLNLYHRSQGVDGSRHAVVSKKPLLETSPLPNPTNLLYVQNTDGTRRPLNRSVTMDFSTQRAANEEQYSTLENSYLGLHPHGQEPLIGRQDNLRMAKSVADLRSASGNTSPQPGRYETTLTLTANDDLTDGLQAMSFYTNRSSILPQTQPSVIGSNRPTTNSNYAESSRAPASLAPERQPALPHSWISRAFAIQGSADSERSSAWETS